MRGIVTCVVLAASAGCLRATEFRCAHDAECGSNGVCEPIGYCSVPDPHCDTGRSYSESAGQGLSSTCVPSAPRAPDPGPGPGAPPDGGTGCDPDYAAIGGSPHVYKALIDRSWDQAAIECA